MVAYTFNPSEAEAGRLLCIWGQSVLHSEFQDSQYDKVKTYLKQTNKKNKNKIQDQHNFHIKNQCYFLGYKSKGKLI